MKTKPPGFFILNALGEMQLVREGDLIAVRAPRHRARPFRIVARLGKAPSPVSFRALGFHPISREPRRNPVTVRAGDVLGFWQ